MISSYYNIIRKMGVVCLFTLILSDLTAQPKAVCRKYIITDSLYSIRLDKENSWDTSAYFPEYFYYDNINELFGAVETNADEFGVVWKKEFIRPAMVRKDTTVVYIRIKTKNIKEYSLWYFDCNKNLWLKKIIAVPFDGYQIPYTEMIGSWEEAVDAVPGVGYAVKSGQSTFIISVMPKFPGQSFRFTIGDLIFGHQYEKEFVVRHPFFFWLNKGLTLDTNNHQPLLKSNYFTELPDAMSDYNLSSKIYINNAEGATGAVQEREIFRNIIDNALFYYPFYHEKRLNKAIIQKEIGEIFSDRSLDSYCLLTDSIARYIKNVFDDLHFYLDKPKEGYCAVKTLPLQRSSVRIAEIKNRLVVVGKFDTSYKTVDVSDELLAIDGIPTQRVLDSISAQLYLSKVPSPYKRFSMITALLDRMATDSCKITTRQSASSNEVSETVLKYNTKFSIPKNFRTVHGELRQYGNIVYFRINSWDESVFLRFINEWDKISQSEGIVIDLRGNGGGELMAAMQFFSIFIGKPQIYLRFLNSKQQFDPVVILPDKIYRYAATKPIVLLGDQSTACASETFIKAMKNLSNVRFVASGRTTGSLAAKFDVQLPSGLIVHVNSLQNKICYNGKFDVVENTGITPDTLISIDSVEDLRPYNDKLLKQALKFLSADNRDLPKTD
jgi:C-terminal processing protease CtpA/Prc